jgi:hypothetical protein
MFFSFDITTPDHKDVSKMISYVKAIATDKSKIVINPKHFDLTFSYHFDQSVFSNHVSFSESMESKGIYSIYNISELKRIQNKSGDHIIYVDAHSDFLYPNNGVYKRLCSSYELKDEKIFDKNIRVCEFVKKVH